MVNISHSSHQGKLRTFDNVSRLTVAYRKYFESFKNEIAVLLERYEFLISTNEGEKDTYSFPILFQGKKILFNYSVVVIDEKRLAIRICAIDEVAEECLAEYFFNEHTYLLDPENNFREEELALIYDMNYFAVIILHDCLKQHQAMEKD